MVCSRLLGALLGNAAATSAAVYESRTPTPIPVEQSIFARTSVGYAFPPHSKTKVEVFNKPDAQNENLDSGANAAHTARYAHLVLGEDKRLAVLSDTSVQQETLQKIDSLPTPPQTSLPSFSLFFGI